MDEAKGRYLKLKRLKRHRWRLKHPSQRKHRSVEPGDAGPYGRLPPAGGRQAADSGRHRNIGHIGATLADVWPKSFGVSLSGAGGAVTDAARKLPKLGLAEATGSLAGNSASSFRERAE